MFVFFWICLEASFFLFFPLGCDIFLTQKNVQKKRKRLFLILIYCLSLVFFFLKQKNMDQPKEPRKKRKKWKGALRESKKVGNIVWEANYFSFSLLFFIRDRVYGGGLGCVSGNKGNCDGTKGNERLLPRNKGNERLFASKQREKKEVLKGKPK